MSESKEGKLKKQVRFAFANIDFEEIDQEKHINEYLDEAKKEFPPELQQMIKKATYLPIGWRLTDLQVWFEKWFGEQ